MADLNNNNLRIEQLDIIQADGDVGDLITVSDSAGSLVLAVDINGDLTLTTINQLSNVNTAVSPPGGSVLYYNTVGANWEDTQLFVQGTKQTIQSVFGNIIAISGTTEILQDTVSPLVTDGSQVWVESFTPSRADGEIGIVMSFAFAITNAASEVAIAIFRDNVCIGAMVDTASSSGGYQTVSFAIKDPGPFVAGTALTYQARVGRNGGNATWYINTNSSGENFGGVLSNNAYTISEVVIL